MEGVWCDACRVLHRSSSTPIYWDCKLDGSPGVQCSLASCSLRHNALQKYASKLPCLALSTTVLARLWATVGAVTSDTERSRACDIGFLRVDFCSVPPPPDLKYNNGSAAIEAFNGSLILQGNHFAQKGNQVCL